MSDGAQPDRRKVRVVYIAGAGFSGSTLLEQALSQVDGCVSVGEPYRPMFEPYWPTMTCGCGELFAGLSLLAPGARRRVGRRAGSGEGAPAGPRRRDGRPLVRSAFANSSPRHSLRAAFREIGGCSHPCTGPSRSGPTRSSSSTRRRRDCGVWACWPRRHRRRRDPSRARQPRLRVVEQPPARLLATRDADHPARRHSLVRELGRHQRRGRVPRAARARAAGRSSTTRSLASPSRRWRRSSTGSASAAAARARSTTAS